MTTSIKARYEAAPAFCLRCVGTQETCTCEARQLQKAKKLLQLSDTTVSLAVRVGLDDGEQEAFVWIPCLEGVTLAKDLVQDSLLVLLHQHHTKRDVKWHLWWKPHNVALHKDVVISRIIPDKTTLFVRTSLPDDVQFIQPSETDTFWRSRPADKTSSKPRGTGTGRRIRKSVKGSRKPVTPQRPSYPNSNSARHRTPKTIPCRSLEECIDFPRLEDQQGVEDLAAEKPILEVKPPFWESGAPSSSGLFKTASKTSSIKGRRVNLLALTKANPDRLRLATSPMLDGITLVGRNSYPTTSDESICMSTRSSAQ